MELRSRLLAIRSYLYTLLTMLVITMGGLLYYGLYMPSEAQSKLVGCGVYSPPINYTDA